MPASSRPPPPRLRCARPCSPEDRERLQYLYDEWAHPYFVSVEEYGRIMEVGAAGRSIQCSCSAHLLVQLIGSAMAGACTFL